MRWERLKVRGFGPFRELVEIDLRPFEGQVVALVGEIGAGKSTLLELLAASLYRTCPTRGALTDLAVARDALLEVDIVHGGAHTLRHEVDPVARKGRSLVLDAEGKPVAAGARAFDAWAKEHVPPEELLYASTFSPQKSDGFLAMTDGERKAVLLRALGIERLELLSERARRRASAAKQALELARQRRQDEESRAQPIAAAEAELADRRAQVAASASDAERAQDALARARCEAHVCQERARLEGRRAEAARALVVVAREVEARRVDVAASTESAAARSALPGLRERERTLAFAVEEQQTAATVARQRAADAHAEAERLATVERDLASRYASDMATHTQTVDAAAQAVAQAESRHREVATLLTASESIEAAAVRASQLTEALREAEEKEARAREAAVALRVALGKQRVDLRTAQAMGSTLERAIQEARTELAQLEREDLASPSKAVDAALADAEARLTELEQRCEMARAKARGDAARRILHLREGLAEVAYPEPEATLVTLSRTARCALQRDDEGVEAQDELSRDEASAAQARAAIAVLRESARAHAQQTCLRSERRAKASERIARGDAEKRAVDSAAKALREDVARQERELALVEETGRTLTLRATTLRDELTEVQPLAGERARLEVARGQASMLKELMAERVAHHARATAAREACTRMQGAALTSARQGALDAEAHGRVQDDASAEAERMLQARQCAWNDARRELVEAEHGAELGPNADEARARLAEVEQRHAVEASKEAALCAELAALPPPDEDAVQRALDRACTEAAESEKALRQGQDTLAIAESRLVSAREAAERLCGLRDDAVRLESDASDWTRLAQDLGRDGVQALEIDAAGPELTAMANDLLRACAGSRWSLSVETSRVSADGKRALEGCELVMTDHEMGRVGAAESLSGGEAVIVGHAVSLALAMLSARRSGAERPTLVRDESAAALSATTAPAYVAMLRRAAQMIDAASVLLVSHNPELHALADVRLHVEDGRVERRVS